VRSLTHRLRGGGTALGAFLSVDSPDIAELLGLVGYDFVVIDAEHGAFGPREVLGLVRAASCPTIVRVPERDEALAGAALDAGASGVQFTAVSSGQSAAAVARSCRYPPRGARGLSYYTRGAGYTTAERKAVLDADPIVTVQIESVEGVRNADAIAAADGVDVVFFGPTDYGVEHAATGEGPAPEEAAATVLAAAQRHARAAGIYAVGAAAARARLDDGFRYVTIGVVPLLVRGLRSVLEEIGA
jgi:4-hydroxy-2-oxoheptanedioate aldolase